MSMWWRWSFKERSFHNRVRGWDELKVVLFYLENWLSMKWRTGSRSSPSSSAVVPDLNIEVKIVSRLWNVRPSCADWTSSLSRLWGGLAGLNKGHERVQLVVRYLVSNSWLSGGRLTDGI